LDKNAFTNAPFVSIGKIFGAIPPPRKTPPSASTLSARFALGTVNIAKHIEGVNANRIASASAASLIAAA